jgi:hypothetical protein
MLSTKYICYKCNKYDTTRFSDIKRHLCRKNTCHNRNEVMLMSEDKIFVMSLMPYYNNSHSIELNDLEHLSESDILSKNKDEIFNEILNIEKNNIRKCKYCEEEFKLISDLKRHILINCFYKNTSNKSNISINNSINISNNTNSNNITNNTYNNCDINNNCEINNINLYVDVKLPEPIPFSDNWDLSKITNERLISILVSDYIYSGLLNAILENEINNNVIINSDKKSGIVYMDHDNKYMSVRSNIIAEKTMEKLYENLKDINGKIKTNLNDIIYKVIRNNINDKNKEYNDKTQKQLKNNIDNLMCSIYNNNKKTAIKLSKNVQTNDEIKKQIKKEHNRFKKQNNDYSESDSDDDIEYSTNKEKYMEQLKQDKY